MTYKTFLASSIILLLVIVPLQAFPIASATSASTGILIPLYCAPYGNDMNQTPCPTGNTSCTGTTFCWQTLVAARNNSPHTPIVAIINLGVGAGGAMGGPGTAKLADYASGIATLHNAGVTVVGYVSTANGARNTNYVTSDIDNWKSWYQSSGMTGIFFDEMANTAGLESTYSGWTSHAKADGMTYVIGNPGTSTLVSYIGTVDTLNIDETTGGTGVPSISDLQADTFVSPDDKGLDKHNFSYLVFCQTSLPGISAIGNRSNYVGLMFYTGRGCTADPWAGIPSYFSTLASDLNKQTANMTINSINSLGQTITGYLVTVTQNGNIIPSGETPLAYNGTTGVKYVFTPQSFNFCLFDHWQDTGSTTASRTILVNSTNREFTAVYKDNGGTCQ